MNLSKSFSQIRSISSVCILAGLILSSTKTFAGGTINFIPAPVKEVGKAISCYYKTLPGLSPTDRNFALTASLTNNDIFIEHDNTNFIFGFGIADETLVANQTEVQVDDKNVTLIGRLDRIENIKMTISIDTIVDHLFNDLVPSELQTFRKAEDNIISIQILSGKDQGHYQFDRCSLSHELSVHLLNKETLKKGLKDGLKKQLND